MIMFSIQEIIPLRKVLHCDK